MFIMHIALQGCIRGTDVPYGLTSDTGGHIRYVLDLVRALEKQGVVRQEIIARRFVNDKLGKDFAEPLETISASVDLIRIDGKTTYYLPKEEIYTEEEALWQSLKRHIESLDRKPDILHAHYADAGDLAAKVKRTFGIPYFFTAHSLGKVKAKALGDQTIPEDLARRIDIENCALLAANRIIASSRDEADVQYRLYEQADPAQIRVIPPGCDTHLFSSDCLFDERVERSIQRFLEDPGKPPVLALARPIWKKNLHGLVKAYGESKDLQRRANLVIFAGCRSLLKSIDGESHDVFNTLFELIDDYDLYGKVALPKTHRPEDVPCIYQYASALGGVFANTAFNEPFGLTLLEAAASGVPVVATNSGGPNDIVDHLQNGVCVPPTCPATTVSAIISLLDDSHTWTTLSENGRKRVENYSWEAHAKEYLEEVAATLQPRKHFVTKKPIFSRLLVSDIDNTLVGCADGLRDFGRWHATQQGYCFAIATGRGIHSATDILRRHRTPSPTVLVTGVGSDIFYAHDETLRDLSFDQDWRTRISRNWDPVGIAGLLNGVHGVLRQPLIDQSPVKLSYFVDDPRRRGEIEMILCRQGFEATVILSHERYLDILPARASKGGALAYLANRFNVTDGNTIAAGDSGNDEHMLRTAGMGIVVANHSTELALLSQHPSAYFAKHPYAAGIVEGIHAHRELSQ